MKPAILAFALFAASNLNAQAVPAGHRNPVARFVSGYAHQFKEQFADVKQHPFAWGVPFVIKVAVQFADAGSSCAALGRPGIEEGNPLIGRHPSCGKIVALDSLFQFGIIQPATHYISDSWTQRCHDDAANPDSRWNRKDAFTHDPESCRWNVPYAGLAFTGYQIAVIKHNVDIAEKKPKYFICVDGDPIPVPGEDPTQPQSCKPVYE